MNDSEILTKHRDALKRVKTEIRGLQTAIPTPAIMQKAFELAQERICLEDSITDLEGAVIAGADR